MTIQDQTSLNVENPIEKSALPLDKNVLTVDRPRKQVDRQRIDEYAELKRLVKQRGLLDKQRAYYTYKILSTAGLFAISLTVLALVDTLWVQLINAGFLAIIFAQTGFIGHDAAHRQIFSSARKNELTGLTIGFVLALDRSWWVDKHNRHHNNPNNVALDPDADLPILAFTKEQALKKRGLYRFIVKYQAPFFYPMLLFEEVGLRLAGIIFLLTHKIKYPVLEPMLIVGHFVVYFGLVFSLLSTGHAVLFVIVHQAVFGLIVGSAFAPNHKGMLVVEEDEEMDFFRRQVLTSRNMRAHPITDFWFGGLNYQIEHHLFPNMPRKNLKEAQKITKAFCSDHSIPYHETGVIQSQIEILQYLHEESSPLRAGKA
jgi:fatty acid desaturase